MKGLHQYRSHLAVFAAYFFALSIAYFPIIDKNFSADDFRVLWRVCHDKQFVMESFFRILSDASLYFNFLIGGYQSFYFNLFNLLVHLACSFLVYFFCLQTRPYWAEKKIFFPFCSGFFFLLYPFHSEAVVWIVGRSSSLATLFALIAICLAVSELHDGAKNLLVSVAYLLGLLAYESILSFPLIILLLNWMKKPGAGTDLQLIAYLVGAMIIYFILKVSLSGSVLGAYGAGIAELTFSNFAEHFLKMSARLIAPPNQQTSRFLAGVAVAAVCWTLALFFYVKSRWKKNESIFSLVMIALLFLSSLIVAVSFPVSTRTTSSDRLLYFPSVFLCIAASMIISELFASRGKLLLAVGMLGVLGLWGIYATNRNWIFASDSTSRILDVAKDLSVKGINVYLVNIPDEHQGAYMLAGVLNEALLINRIDTSRIHQVNILRKEDKGEAGRILPVKREGEVSIFPGIRVIKMAGQSRITYAGQAWSVEESDQIWYWDREEFRRLE